MFCDGTTIVSLSYGSDGLLSWLSRFNTKLNWYVHGKRESKSKRASEKKRVHTQREPIEIVSGRENTARKRVRAVQRWTEREGKKVAKDSNRGKEE